MGIADPIESAVRTATNRLRRRIPHYVDIEDIAQEVRLKCWCVSQAPEYKAAKNKAAFLQQSAFWAGLRWVRTEAHLRGITETQYRCGGGESREISLDALGKDFGGDGLAGRVASRDCVLAFLQSLPDGERIACEQRLQGLTSDETAYLTGGNASSVRRRLMRVRHKAKEWFGL